MAQDGRPSNVAGDAGQREKKPIDRDGVVREEDDGGGRDGWIDGQMDGDGGMADGGWMEDGWMGSFGRWTGV